jgi:Peptidase C80 family
MYLHDFRCPNCKAWYNRKWYSEETGKMWCATCKVECLYDETFCIQDEPLTQYDRQLIVQLTNTKNYGPVKQAGSSLHNKALRKGLLSDIVEIDPGQVVDSSVKTKLALLTGKSRFYIIGHGAGDKLQGVSAFDLAYTVRYTWMVTGAKRITLVSCEIGGAKNTMFGNSFAKDFHSLLKKIGKISTEVAAYERSVSVSSEEYAKLQDRPELEGKKVFYYTDTEIRWVSQDEDAVKIVWYWDQETQKSKRRSA